jgi:hypothetical protein
MLIPPLFCEGGGSTVSKEEVHIRRGEFHRTQQNHFPKQKDRRISKSDHGIEARDDDERDDDIYGLQQRRREHLPPVREMLVDDVRVDGMSVLELGGFLEMRFLQERGGERSEHEYNRK